jgi:hypothetical protein
VTEKSTLMDSFAAWAGVVKASADATTARRTVLVRR